MLARERTVLLDGKEFSKSRLGFSRLFHLKLGEYGVLWLKERYRQILM